MKPDRGDTQGSTSSAIELYIDLRNRLPREVVNGRVGSTVNIIIQDREAR